MALEVFKENVTIRSEHLAQRQFLIHFSKLIKTIPMPIYLSRKAAKMPVLCIHRYAKHRLEFLSDTIYFA